MELDTDYLIRLINTRLFTKRIDISLQRYNIILWKIVKIKHQIISVAMVEKKSNNVADTWKMKH